MQTMKEQEKKMELIRTKTAKNSFTRIKPSLDMYRDFIAQKGKMATEQKGKIDLAKFYLNTEGVLSTIMKLNENKELAGNGEILAKKQNVDKKHLTLVKLRAAAKIGDWGAFVDIIKKDKPKIPAQYFAQTCIEFNNKDLAINYIKQIPILEDKVSMLFDIE